MGWVGCFFPPMFLVVCRCPGVVLRLWLACYSPPSSCVCWNVDFVVSRQMHHWLNICSRWSLKYLTASSSGFSSIQISMFKPSSCSASSSLIVPSSLRGNHNPVVSDMVAPEGMPGTSRMKSLSSWMTSDLVQFSKLIWRIAFCCSTVCFFIVHAPGRGFCFRRFCRFRRLVPVTSVGLVSWFWPITHL